jgi:hypothetical protein
MQAMITSGIEVGLNAGVGYLYGAVFNADRKLAAQVWAITNAASIIFARLPAYCLTKTEQNRKQVQGVLHAMVSAASIVASRQLGLIATTGTYVFSAVAVLTFLNAFSESR